jgi:plastocyanin
MAIEGTVPRTRIEDAGSLPAVAPGTRSTAMWLMPIAAVAEALITIVVMSSIGFIPPLMVFLVVLVAIAVLGFARPRPRVFVTGGIVLAVFIAMNLPFAIDGLIHPIGTSHAWTDIIAIVVGVTGAIAGFAAFAELRRDKPAIRAFRAPTGEAMAILVVGVLVGTSYVSVSGFSTLEGTPGLGVANGVITAPAQAPVELDAAGSVFTQKVLQLSTGPGTVYVVNADAGPHTFDIELNGRALSYPVPARSTAAVVLDLAVAGKYTYWCAIPGHRSTMEGTLEVIER